MAVAPVSCSSRLPLGAGESSTGGTTSGSGSTTGVGTQSTDPVTTDPATDPGSGTAATAQDSSGTPGSEGPPPVLFDVGGGMATGTTGDDTTTGIVIDWDCDALPDIEQTELVSARGYHDVFFDEDGHILGWDGSAIVAVTYDDQLSVWLPGVNSAQAFDRLDNGDVLYTNDYGELRRVTPDLQNTVVATGLFGAYGITVGPDQQAYVSRSQNVARVDPESGEVVTWVTLPGNTTPRALVFNLDSTGAYISTLTFGNAPVYFVEVDDELMPSADPVVFATGVGEGYHDGLGIDACGNLYVPDYDTSGLYRVAPDGTVTTLYSQGFAGQPHYGHGLEWGSGLEGWNDHAIYLPQPYDGGTVNEVVLGVPSGSLVRTWSGGG
ncbi:MAG: hypothetical protein U0168_29130 [Nannocystaceae bacterium]